MGHCVSHQICDDTAQARAELVEHMRNEAIYYSDAHAYDGAPRWRDDIPPFDTLKSASEWLDAQHGGNIFHGDEAVRFHDASEFIERGSKKIDALEAKREEIRAKRRKYAEKHSPFARKSATIGCAECGSKLNRAALAARQGWREPGREYCPVCGASLLTDTAKEALARYDERIDEIGAKIEAEKQEIARRNRGKSPVRWVVRFDYHC